MDNERDQSVGLRVRNELKFAHMSQTRAAELIGVTQQAMSRRLLGRVPFSVTELLTLAEALDTSVGALVGETAAKK